jgi:hypothetical protein
VEAPYLLVEGMGGFRNVLLGDKVHHAQGLVPWWVWLSSREALSWENAG